MLDERFKSPEFQQLMESGLDREVEVSDQWLGQWKVAENKGRMQPKGDVI